MLKLSKKKKKFTFHRWIFSGREIYNLSRIDVQVLSISIKIPLKKKSLHRNFTMKKKKKNIYIYIYILSNFLSFLIIKKKEKKKRHVDDKVYILSYILFWHFWEPKLT